MSNKEDKTRRNAEIAAQETWSQFERLGDCLDELAHEHGDEEAREAFGAVEDLVTDLDDVLNEAQQAVKNSSHN